jgi:hypothetical protein
MRLEPITDTRDVATDGYLAPLYPSEIGAIFQSYKENFNHVLNASTVLGQVLNPIDIMLYHAIIMPLKTSLLGAF